MIRSAYLGEIVPHKRFWLMLRAKTAPHFS